MRERKLKIGIARFPYGGNGGAMSEHLSVGKWLMKLVPQIKADPRCEGDGVWEFIESDTPITMVRNRALRRARMNGVDVLLMVDSDQIPDLYVGKDPLAKPFWDTAFDFLYRHYDKGPCVIAAPYCGPPPDPVEGGCENVYVFHWANSTNWRKGEDEPNYSLAQFSREEAAMRSGIEEVAALPTGLCMIDTRVCDLLDPPWFKYEWMDEYESDKASTEDVYFTRNCSLLGIPQYCTWDSWAGHAKPAIVGKPQLITSEQVGAELRKAARRDLRQGQSVREIGVGKTPAEIADGLGLDPPVLIEPDETRDPDGFSQDISRVAATLAPLADAANGLSPGGVMPRNTGKVAASMLDVLGLELRPKFDDQRTTRFGVATPQCDLDALQALVRTLVEENPDRPLKIIEIGSWLGTSAMAMADVLGPQSGTIHCIDTWAGSKGDFSGVMADVIGGADTVFETFKRCVGDRLGTVIFPHQMTSLEAAEVARGAHATCLDEADLIFIDAGHEPEEAAADIEAWLPHVREGGILAGHDYGTDMFPGVTQAVDQLGGCQVAAKAPCTVWWTRIPKAEEVEGNGELATVCQA